jgi:nucleotide-binding universal stress UspA family protein
METHKIKRMLIPMDFSETGLLALEHGAFMARTFKADLYLLHIIEAKEFAFNVYDPVLLIKDENDDEMEEIATIKLEELRKKIADEYGVNAIPLINYGRVVTGIKEAAKENEINLIVMGTHGAKGFEEYFIGSNAHKALEISPCPVLTIQLHTKKYGFKNIVMPIDNSLHSRQKVNTVIELASLFNSTIHILGLLNTEENENENKFNIKIKTVEDAVKKAKLSYDLKIVKGENLAVEAMSYSDEIGADLIVIMSDHESNIKTMIFGGSKQIVNHSNIPVLSIKPAEGHFEINTSGSSFA